MCGLKNDNGSIDINTDCKNPYSINFSNTNCSSYSGTYRSCIEDGPKRGSCRPPEWDYTWYCRGDTKGDGRGAFT